MRQPFRKASVYITLLLILEVLTGLLIVIVTAIYLTLMSNYMDDTDCELLHSYMFNIFVFGIQLILIFLCSVSMWRRLWSRRCTPNVRLLLTVWLFYLCIIIGSGFASLWNVYHNVAALETAAEASLTRGIDKYYSCPEWKLLWDGLQLRKECCGVRSYKDWMYADWMPRLDKNSSANAALAPYACCKRSCESCFTNYGPGANNNGHPFPTLTIENINTDGCLKNFISVVWHFIYITLVLCLLALKFMILLCCLTKYIVNGQNVGDGCDNAGLIDDEGRPVVIVKYPGIVNCITIAEEDLASDIAPDNCNCDDAVDVRNSNYYVG